MASLIEIVEFSDEYLSVSKFNDYCPNGLQVEGVGEIKKIITGVSASQMLIDAAVEKNADLILVHHGFFWKGESQVIIGMKHKKIETLINNKINLLAYHLPLDAHLVCGNNVQLANKLGLKFVSMVGPGSVPLIAETVFDEAINIDHFVNRVDKVLGRQPIHIGANKNKKIKTVAICTGGAQNYFPNVIEYGFDVYLTGEVSEQHYHMAMESGVDFIAAGHHATEKFGVQALGRIISEKFDVEVEYVEIHNPI